MMIALNGTRPSKNDHPAVPISLPEIVATARVCHSVGACAMHLHTHDDNNAHSFDPGQYVETLSEVTNVVPKLHLHITTEAISLYYLQEQLNCINTVAPGLASIPTRESARDPNLASRVYGTCADTGCEVQHILCNTVDVALLKAWQAVGMVSLEQYSVLFLLGRYNADQTSTPSDIHPFLATMPDTRNRKLCALGSQEHACLSHAAKLVGNIRAGFENSFVACERTRHIDNAGLVSALSRQTEGSQI